jgi:superfamily II DNA or RNA helicase
MTLYPYQQKIVSDILSGFRQFNRQLVICPTGSGKTIMFGAVAKAWLPGKTLVLAHRGKLIEQAEQKFHAAWGLFAQIEQGTTEASLTGDIIISTVQTMIRRLNKWPSDHFSLVVVDEAHHVLSAEYKTVLEHFSGQVLGVTATPDRGDKKSLGAYFENIASELFYFDLVADGYLIPLTIKSVPIKIDLNAVKHTTGDYDADSLGSALEPYLPEIAKAIADHAAFRKVLVFTPLIATSQRFVEHCRALGLRAAHVDGKSEDQAELLSAFERGEYDLLSNAMLLTEGYDCPTVDCIVNLRATSSRALFAQIIGRGTRIARFKQDCLVLDFLWQHEKHSLIRPYHLISETDDLAEIMQDLAESNQEELDLQDLASQAESNRLELIRRREESLQRELERNAKRKARTISAIDFAVSARALAIADWHDTMAWHSDAVTEKQAKMLRAIGIDPASVKSKGHAGAVLGVFFKRRGLGLATPKQVKLMKHLGHPHAELIRMADATEWISAKLSPKVSESNLQPVT